MQIKFLIPILILLCTSCAAPRSVQNCVVTNGSGIATAPVTNVVVNCSSQTNFTISGTVSGLAVGEVVTLQNNNVDTITVPNGPFTFPIPVSLYNVTVAVTTGPTYYISPSGNDSNNGSIELPWLTIQHGVSQLTAGARLYIRGGIYTGVINTINSVNSSVPNGTNFGSGAIIIAGYPNEIVTIRPPQGSSAISLTVGATHYLIFQDLIIDMINQVTPISDPDGVYLSSGVNHIRFQHLEVKNNASSGLHFSSNGGASGFNEVINSSIHDNGRTDIAGNGGYGIYLSTSNNIIENNDFYANNGYAVHLNPVEGEGNNNIIRQNRIHNNFVHGTIGGGGSTSYGIVVMRGSNNLVYNNLVYANQGGILVYTGSMNTLVYNNTVTGNLGHAGGGECGINLQYWALPPILQNNIVYNNVSGAICDDGGGTGVPVVDHNLMTDPHFTNSAANDFSLQSSSPAIDVGTAISSVPNDFINTVRPQNLIYDIGAYEFIR